MTENAFQEESWTPVQKGFSRQSVHYDADDIINPILTAWRKKVYAHAEHFLKRPSRILEINAGTGIDALHFVQAGHSVHATDVSPGMIRKIREKIDQSGAAHRFTVQQCSFESLYEIPERKFDFIFSNFGGLNCCCDLSLVTRHLEGILHDGAYLTWVVMPPVSPWEWTWILKGQRKAFRRLANGGIPAHVEGETITTYYHSLRTIQQKLGTRFRLIKSEGLGALSPPPSSLKFIQRHPTTWAILSAIDDVARLYFPFNRWADHLIVTFQYKP